MELCLKHIEKVLVPTLKSGDAIMDKLLTHKVNEIWELIEKASVKF